MRKASGFTIVEILIVVGIIGILTTIGFIGFSKFQADTRDSERASKATIIVEALEKYYDKNGEYPSCSSLMASPGTVTTTTLPGLEQSTLEAPQGDTNSIKCQDLTSLSQEDFFAYVGGDTSTACTGVSGTACVIYNLKYKEESSGSIKTIESRRKVAVSGAPLINCSTASFTQINCSWSSVSGAITYDFQYATDSGFTTGVITTSSISSPSRNQTGLSYCTTYYLRARAVGGSGAGSWSLYASVTTTCLATPVCNTPIANSFTQITASWGAVSGATSYLLEYDNDSNFSSLTGTYSGTSLSSARTGLSYGTTYYFRVRAVVTSGNSAWSAGGCQVATLSLATPPPPTNCGVTLSSFCADIPDIANASGYDFQCSSDNATWGAGCDTGTIAASTHNFTGATSGYTYYVRAKAVNGAYSSGWSGSTAITTLSPTPSPATYCWGYFGRNSPRYVLYLYIWEADINVSANQSNVNWRLYRAQNTIGYNTYDLTTTWPWSVTITALYAWSGTSNSSAFRYDTSVGVEETIATGGLTIQHDANGNASIEFIGHDGYSNKFYNGDCSGTYVLSDLR